MLGVARDSERDRQPCRRERLAHLAAKPVGQHVCPVLVGVGREQRELLAADASRDVDAPLALLDHGGDRLEGALRGRVAVLLVEVLEAVDVDHDEADRPVAAASALELELRDLLQPAPVEQAGVRVGPRGVGEPADQLPDAHAHRADHPRGERHGDDRPEPHLERTVVAPHHEAVRGRDERHLAGGPEPVQEVAGLKPDRDVEDRPDALARVAEELDGVRDEDRREGERRRRGPRRQPVLGAKAEQADGVGEGDQRQDPGLVRVRPSSGGA